VSPPEFVFVFENRHPRACTLGLKPLES
jgi:hypothetical protein